jgi:hypothetical protein
MLEMRARDRACLSREVMQERGWAMATKARVVAADGDDKNDRTPPGVWNRGKGKGPVNPIRVRTKRLDQIDGDKIALAFWLLAKQIVENGSDRLISEEEARQVARELEASGEAGGSTDTEPTGSNPETGQ